MLVNILDTNTGEHIARDLPFWGIADALINWFCGPHFNSDVYNTCIALADAFAKGEPCGAYESYLGCEVETV